MVKSGDNTTLEILKRIQSDICDMKGGLRDINAQLASIRHHMHAADSDNLRQDDRLAGFESRLKRIETRLGLLDDNHT